MAYILTMLGTDTQYSPVPHQYSMQVLPSLGQAFPSASEMKPFVIYISVAEKGDQLKYSLLIPSADGSMSTADVGTVYSGRHSNGWSDKISQFFRAHLRVLRDIYYWADNHQFTVKNVTENLAIHATIRACAASKGNRLLTAYPCGETLSVLASAVEQPDITHSLIAKKDGLPSAVIEGAETLGGDVGVKIRDGLLQLLRVIGETKETNFVIQGHSRGAVESLLLAHELQYILQAISAKNDASAMDQAWLNDLIKNIRCLYTREAFSLLNRAFLISNTENELLKLLKGIKYKNCPIDDIRLSIFAMDPVAGNATFKLDRVAWTDDRMHVVPDIVTEYVVMVQPNEHSRCFKGTVPAHYTAAKTKVTHLSGMGHHGSLSGNPLDQLGHFFEEDPNGERTRDAQLMTLMELMEFLIQKKVSLNVDKLVNSHPLKQVIIDYVNEKIPEERDRQRLACYEKLFGQRSAYDRFDGTSYFLQEGGLDIRRKGEAPDRIIHYGSFADTRLSAVFGKRSAFFVNVNHAKLYLASVIPSLSPEFYDITNDTFLERAKSASVCDSTQQAKFIDAITMLGMSVSLANKPGDLEVSELVSPSPAAKSGEAEDAMASKDQSSARFRELLTELETVETKPTSLDLEILSNLSAELNRPELELPAEDKEEFNAAISVLREKGQGPVKSSSQDTPLIVQKKLNSAVISRELNSQPLTQNEQSFERRVSRFGLTSEVNFNLLRQKQFFERNPAALLAPAQRQPGVIAQNKNAMVVHSPMPMARAGDGARTASEAVVSVSQQDMLHLVNNPALLQDVYNRAELRISPLERGSFSLDWNNYSVVAHLVGSMVHIGSAQIPATLFSNAYQLLESGKNQALALTSRADARSRLVEAKAVATNPTSLYPANLNNLSAVLNQPVFELPAEDNKEVNAASSSLRESSLTAVQSLSKNRSRGNTRVVQQILNSAERHVPRFGLTSEVNLHLLKQKQLFERKPAAVSAPAQRTPGVIDQHKNATVVHSPMPLVQAREGARIASEPVVSVSQQDALHLANNPALLQNVHHRAELSISPLIIGALIGTAIGLALTATGIFAPLGVGLLGLGFSAVLGLAVGLALGGLTFACQLCGDDEQYAAAPPPTPVVNTVPGNTPGRVSGLTAPPIFSSPLQQAQPITSDATSVLATGEADVNSP